MFERRKVGRKIKIKKIEKRYGERAHEIKEAEKKMKELEDEGNELNIENKK